eukprot:TRINITY_DN1916_c0_g1_i3.p1 TRINITY_DN1916_c0_g1~~TRINITY_DN1916_c0_g1_i3.p1  ORF type:complete len:154 (-),score=4.57 TRINITY_DN1916_c0_g1_i3:400-861(-)
MLYDSKFICKLYFNFKRFTIYRLNFIIYMSEPNKYSGRKVKIQPIDGEPFEVEIELANELTVVQHMLRDLGEETSINNRVPLNIKRDVLEKVIAYLKHHLETTKSHAPVRRHVLLPWDKGIIHKIIVHPFRIYLCDIISQNFWNLLIFGHTLS